MIYQYDDEWREEIIGGNAVMLASPTLNHNFVSGNIYRIFANYLHGKRCTPFSDNTKLFLEDGEKYIPDMMVVCNPEKLKRNGVYGAPDLVVEVLSPGTAKNDRGHKKDIYEKHGVREYWIVSPGEQSVEQYILKDGAFILQELYTHYSPNMLADMTAEERNAVVTEFQCTLFTDLTIHLEDIFYRVTSGI